MKCKEHPENEVTYLVQINSDDDTKGYVCDTCVNEYINSGYETPLRLVHLKDLEKAD